MQYRLKCYTQKMGKANIDYFYHINWQKLRRFRQKTKEEGIGSGPPHVAWLLRSTGDNHALYQEMCVDDRFMGSAFSWERRVKIRFASCRAGLAVAAGQYLPMAKKGR